MFNSKPVSTITYVKIPGFDNTNVCTYCRLAIKQKDILSRILSYFAKHKTHLKCYMLKRNKNPYCDFCYKEVRDLDKISLQGGYFKSGTCKNCNNVLISGDIEEE